MKENLGSSNVPSDALRAATPSRPAPIPAPNPAPTESMYFNVRDYRAVGDGTTDDTAAIQSALNAAAVAGSVVWFPAGSYLISDTLVYGAAVTLRGVRGASVITNDTGRSNYIMLIPDAAATVTDVVIEDLTFDQRSDNFGFTARDQLLSINKVARVTIRHCTFVNVVTMAVWADTKTADTTTSQVRIENCWIQNSTGGGISLFGDVQDVIITGNRIEHCQDDAIALQDLVTGERPTNAVIAHNTLLNNDTRNKTGSTPHAVLICGCENVTIVDNLIDGTVASAISVQYSTSHSDHAIVANNIVRNAGITVDDTTGVPGHGIMTLTSDNVQILNNIVVGSRQWGIVADKIDWLTVAHNRCEDNPGGTVSIASCTKVINIFNGDVPVLPGLRLNEATTGQLQMKNFSLANNASERLTIDTGYSTSLGFCFVSCPEDGSMALFALAGGNIITYEISDVMNQYSAKAGTASSTNIYCEASTPYSYYIENRRGGDRAYYVLLFVNA
jgi:hypothetical protein